MKYEVSNKWPMNEYFSKEALEIWIKENRKYEYAPTVVQWTQYVDYVNTSPTIGCIIDNSFLKEAFRRTIEHNFWKTTYKDDILDFFK